LPAAQIGDEVVYSRNSYPNTKVRLRVTERVGASLKVKATVTARGVESQEEYLVPAGYVAPLPSRTSKLPSASVETVRHLDRSWMCTVSKDETGVLRAQCPERPLGLAGGLLLEHRGWTLESYVVGWDKTPEGEATVEGRDLLGEIGSRVSNRAPTPRNFGTRE